MFEQRNLIFDLETTGKAASDKITVFGTFDPSKKELTIDYLIPDEMGEEEAQETFEKATNTLYNLNRSENVNSEFISFLEYDINGAGFNNERDLLITACDRLTYNPKTPQTITGFATKYFDLPTIRSRCIHNKIEWMLTGVESIDIMKTFEKKFNTTTVDISGWNKPYVKSFAEKIGADINSKMSKADLIEAVKTHGFTPEQAEEFRVAENLDQPTKTTKSLDEIFSVLHPETQIESPFEDSKEAVEAFKEGNISDVVAHNIVDLYKTWKLYTDAIQYVHEDEIWSTRL